MSATTQTPNSTSTLSKTLGALLGVHAGDSLGATLEFAPWSEIIRKYPNGLRDIIGGGPFSWPAGHATDDTDLTRAVLLAYHARAQELHNYGPEAASSFDIAKASADYAVKWNDGDWPGRKKGSRPEDIGGATDTGIHKYKRCKDAAKSGAGHGSAGNGSLMRCIPTALFTGTPEKRVRESMCISAFTHNDPRCTVACAAYNEIVAALIEGRDVREAVEVGKSVALDLECPAVADAMAEGERLKLAKVASEGPREHGFTPSGFVLHSLTIAIAAVLDERSFEDVLVDVVRLGGDADTNGAIAGGLVGAREGVEGIPERWREKLQFGKEFKDLASEILEVQKGRK